MSAGCSPASLKTMAAAMADARQVLSLLDLTSLEASDDDAHIEALCTRARTPFGSVAAVCIHGPFVQLCRRALAGTGVKVATVVNFPHGRPNASAAALETRTLVASGADEIDMVLPFDALTRARDVVAACREACGTDVTLKVILETGALVETGRIAEASRIAIAAGADFIKTSTGKLPVGATPEAAKTMLAAIRGSGRPVGFKAAGGVRTLEQAQIYIGLAEAALGAGWCTPKTFRIGASGLLDDLLRRLGGNAGSRNSSY